MGPILVSNVALFVVMKLQFQSKPRVIVATILFCVLSASEPQEADMYYFVHKIRQFR